MVNFSTGVDGQMPGIVLITLFVLLVASIRFATTDPSQLVVSKLAAAGIGATLGFRRRKFFQEILVPIFWDIWLRLWLFFLEQK